MGRPSRDPVEVAEVGVARHLADIDKLFRPLVFHPITLIQNPCDCQFVESRLLAVDQFVLVEMGR